MMWLSEKCQIDGRVVGKVSRKSSVVSESSLSTGAKIPIKGMKRS